MKTPVSSVINIEQKQSATPLSAEQQLFNNLIKKIDMQRQQLSDWQATVSSYEQKYASEYVPLYSAYNQHRTDLVLLLDAAYFDAIFNQTDQEKLSGFISSIAVELMNKDNGAPQLKAIFNRHHHTDIAVVNESEELEELDSTQDYVEDVPDYSAAKKMARQRAQQARLEKQEQKGSQSVRAVYRKLASSLHPDKEQDPLERVRKTGLMQRVNMAYANGDLLQLLELQLELEQMDQARLNTLNELNLNHYNQVLAGQSDDLAMEIRQSQSGFKARFQLGDKANLAPAFLLAELTREIAQMKKHTSGFARDLRELKDVKNIKAWLKTYRA
ncbi:hypothetical protein [Solimicrobium silvestre]|uniref:DnaJ domain n=1 Tax=Solimicrobium silvestre TaxID=2099400 RepID=A0A2S9H4K5_9BURK|nr:hypothetical protein [Solimicrobium silvestre]PRC94897.1 DnaJ domain [Solimicrobium silvestre]